MLESLSNKLEFVIGTNPAFAFNIRFFDRAEIQCFLSDGTISTQLQPSEFSVETKASYETGATVTLLLDPLPTGKTLVVKRVVPLTQGIALPNRGPLPTESLERQLDRIVAQNQQQQEELSRAVKVPDGVEASPDEIVEALMQSAENAAGSAAAAAESAAASSGSATAAENSADAAAGSATAAENSADAAAGSATAAENSADAAAASAEVAENVAAETAIELITNASNSINQALTAASALPFTVPARFLVASAKRQLQIKAGTVIPVIFDGIKRIFNAESDITFDVETLLDIGSISNAKDYYVYLVDDGELGVALAVSLDSSYPDGSSAEACRLIGGFHTLCSNVTNNTHDLHGFVSGDILPQSVWCLNHRPVSAPEGMVYCDDGDFWTNIYLCGAKNVIPAFQVNIMKFTFCQALDFCTIMNKRLPTISEFFMLSRGNPDSPNDPLWTTSGGNFAKNSSGIMTTSRLVSNIGCEDALMTAWQFTSEVGGSGSTNYFPMGYGGWKAATNYDWSGGSFNQSSTLAVRMVSDNIRDYGILTGGGAVPGSSGGLTEAQVDDRIDTKTAALTAASHTHDNKNTLDNITAVIEAAAMRNAIIFGGE